MKTIRLMELELEHFKGTTARKIVLNGRNTQIFGDNGTGKTTVYDALMWLLFDKDSGGTARSAIKPRGADGQTCRGLLPTVTAVFSIDGVPLCLRKTLRERWERPQGTARRQLAGNTTEYSIDGVSCKENAYKRAISALLDEETFRMLMSVTYFCGELEWKKRRETLFALAQVASDADLAAGMPQFAEICAILQTQSIEMHQKQLKAQRKDAMEAQNSLPIRMDECRRTADRLRTRDFAALRARENTLQAERTALAAEVMRLKDHTALPQKKAQLREIDAKLRALEAENNQFRQKQQAMQSAYKALQADLRQCQADADHWRHKLEQGERALEAISSERFQEGAVCRLCGQDLPQSAQKRAQNIFETDKKAREKVQQQHLKTYRQTLDTALRRVADCEAAMQAQEESVPKSVVDLPQYRAEKRRFVQEKEALQGAIDTLSTQEDALTDAAERKLCAVGDALRNVREALVEEAVLRKNEARLRQLEQELQAQQAHIDALDQKIALCELFVRWKISHITEAVNARFGAVRFQLFQAHVTDDGLTECCEATVDGVPYGSLNHAAQINAGLEVIGVLGVAKGVRVPLFIDNAESVTQLHPLDTQTIRLTVCARDKQLRIVTA